MPWQFFVCTYCGEVFETFVQFTERETPQCPKCGDKKTEKITWTSDQFGYEKGKKT